MEKLLVRFKSPKRIKQAPLEELAEIVGRQKAGLIKEQSAERIEHSAER